MTFEGYRGGKPVSEMGPPAKVWMTNHSRFELTPREAEAIHELSHNELAGLIEEFSEEVKQLRIDRDQAAAEIKFLNNEIAVLHTRIASLEDE